jgi:hypothetical protein
MCVVCCCRDGTLKEIESKASVKVVDPEAQAKDGGSIDGSSNPDGPALTWQQSMRNVSVLSLVMHIQCLRMLPSGYQFVSPALPVGCWYWLCTYGWINACLLAVVG